MAALREEYGAALADGPQAFFEPLRHSCPWCGSVRIGGHLLTGDLIQHKPGRFRVERCHSCGHLFQNPRLNARGLDFYYRDFYDGLGEQQLDAMFAGRTRSYRRRAASVRPHLVRPGLGGVKRWLDVGTGHGHFCEAARTLLPEVVFDGLDRSEGVEVAERRGRVERGLRGGLTELAGELAGAYDAVSLFHYLEHCTDPLRELEAARTSLRPGGLLVVEVPDPESRYAHLLGRWWLPWLQPQHLHLLPVGNLRGALSDQGFTVLAEQHRTAHEPVDLVAAVWLALEGAVPRDDMPWLVPTGPARRALRGAALLAGVPALAAAALLDHAVAPFADRLGLCNAYRLVARRD
ncbi:class I SAM-dependent methyltransferase [Streptomyces pacificus]|uniref:class I SAM-dependent methyltransferase n=1 Tax=Streptomyces pacificus TaxID=2705029 RepID=UPI0015672E9A|nr:class I SAM-dependent methyltransferase [Streptomyces pacificus]